MAERLTRQARWSRFKRILKNATVAEKGQLACLDTADGALVPASVATTLRPIGTFEESFTGDGVKIATVKLFYEVELALFANASVGPVADANVGANCYIHSASAEVSMTATGKSIAGRVWGVITAGVWVEVAR